MRFVSAPLCMLLGTVWMAWCGAGTVLQAAEAGDADHAIVPGFERFFAPAESELNPAQGGDLLLGELNCTSCHQVEKSHETYVIKKQAPVLDQVGTRVRVGWLRKYLADPQSIKPGTTMPAVFAGLSEQERRDQVEALVHFLASTGTVAHKAAEPNHVANGQKLYHTVGCVACHGPRNDDKAPRLPDSMPLGDLRSKYTIPALTAFLQDPLKYRPSGRMPSLTLKIDELRDITNYLLPDAKYQILNPNLHYAYYEGDWQNLPDFSKLKPEAQGEVAGFDMGVARRQNNMALKFDGFLKIEKDGDYNFIATSDDGSKVWIDGKQVVDNDGIHAPSTKDGRTHLTAGMHEFTAAVFNGGGGVELAIEMEGSGLPRQPVAPSLFLNRDGKRPEVKIDDSDPDALVLNQALVAKGRNLFASAGCASCHALHVENQPIASMIKAPELAKVKPGAGCLSDAAATGRPQYKLSAAEKKAITAALPAFAQPRPAIEAPEQIARTMLSLNCYACHQRGELGGVTPERTSFFETTQKEMGDEGRIPPPLNGVGAKIVHSYLKNIVSNGSKDRPYMLTRMPKFGERNVGKLADDFSAVDKIEPVETPKFDEPIRHVKASGRFMVGDKAFSCIKCHNFRGIQSTGIQAIDLTILTK
ncbi:MAG TPA: c-type cytochrome, partial [Planctomycetaceae bacterium]|nr:c-type cytochrome [Planctomycetaceae bacterium]